jgi:hypothetical protein
LRDFHDQKDLFKAISQVWPDGQKISWVDGQIYVIDIFLRFMAMHGYTLQKTRFKNQQFADIDKTIRDENAKREAAYSSLLESVLSGPTTPDGGGSEYYIKR